MTFTQNFIIVVIPETISRSFFRLQHMFSHNISLMGCILVFLWTKYLKKHDKIEKMTLFFIRKTNFFTSSSTIINSIKLYQGYYIRVIRTLLNPHRFVRLQISSGLLRSSYIPKKWLKIRYSLLLLKKFDKTLWERSRSIIQSFYNLI